MTGAADFVPVGATVDRLRAAALACTGCALHLDTTQTVLSKGPAVARVVFVGEQPGDVEDRKGEPFVGPAGKLLDRALVAVGLDPRSIYMTNAVKHFKHKASAGGGRRIHATPEAADVDACLPWLLAEFAVLSPDIVVTLGATAAKALFGPAFRVTRSRGILMPWPACAQRPVDFGHDGDDDAPAGAYAMATIHPSAVLRADNSEAAFAGLVSDLRLVVSVL